MVDTQGSIGLRENPETSAFFTSRSRVFSQSFSSNSLYPILFSRIINSIYIFSRQRSIQVHPSFILPLQNDIGLQKFEHHSNPRSYCFSRWFDFSSPPSTEGVESTRGNSVCLSVCLSVRLSVITFSFFEYSIIWWSRPCKPNIFWQLIVLVTSTALFWPSSTEYQSVPPSTDPVFNDLMV